jgi:hypothetical protein
VVDGSLDFVRVPASARFRFFAGTATQTDITFYALHFKSKGNSTSCSTPDCTDKRELEAADLRDILKHHENLGEYAIAGGDFNDYVNSSPIAILDAAPEVQSLFMELPADQRYSYIFNGESEVLDHIYITRNLKATRGATWSHSFSPVHVNADFPSAEHASDHDPLRVVFSFAVQDDAGLPSADLTDLGLSYDLAWHKGTPALWLGGSATQDTSYALDADNTTDGGVTPLFGTAWQPGSTVSISVTVGSSGSGSGWLSGWLDWNKNGVFESGEKAVNQAVSPGTHTLTLVIPLGAKVGKGVDSILSVRFRLYESATEPDAPVSGNAPVGLKAASPSGGVTGGEVEDSRWGFGPTALQVSSLKAESFGVPGWLWLLMLIGCASLSGAGLRRRLR